MRRRRRASSVREVAVGSVQIVVGFHVIGDGDGSPLTKSSFDRGWIRQSVFGLDFEHDRFPFGDC